MPFRQATRSLNTGRGVNYLPTVGQIQNGSMPDPSPQPLPGGSSNNSSTTSPTSTEMSSISITIATVIDNSPQTTSASASPSQVTSGSNHGINSQTLVAIVVPVVVVSVTIFLLGLFFLARRSRRKKRDRQEDSHSQMRDASGGGVLKDSWRVSERAPGVPLHGVHSNSFAEPIPRQAASLQIPSIQSPDELPAIGNPQRGLRESTGNEAQETTRGSYHQYHDAGHAARAEGSLAALVTGEHPERRSESPFDDPVRGDDVSDISRPGSPVDEMDSISDVSSLDGEHDEHDEHEGHGGHNQAD